MDPYLILKGCAFAPLAFLISPKACFLTMAALDSKPQTVTPVISCNSWMASVELDVTLHEGTAKSSPLRRPQLVQNCRRTKSDVNLAECQGTVPYLGSFLTDLTMIDQGTQDYTEEGLINFEKRRKEFEVLAKLRLFQSAARAYHIPMDRVFCAWFHFLPCLSEKECFNRSLEIEQPATMSTPDMSSRHNTSLSNGNSSGPPKSSTLSRLFNSSRSAEDSITNVSQSHSHSQSQSSFAEPMLDGMSGVSPAGMRMSNENCTKFEEWIDGRVDGGPPGPVSLSRTHSRTVPGVQSFTAPSTPASSVSYKGGRSTFYQQRIGCEFSPLEVFPHKRAYSGDSTQELEASMSAAMPECSRAFYEHSRADCDDTGFNASDQRRGGFHQSDASTCSSSSYQSSGPQADTGSFHLARVGLDDESQTNTGCANYKCIKVKNGDRMNELITRALEKHLLDGQDDEYCLVQLLPNGGEFQLPDKCNPFYAMAPDPSSPMLNLLLRKRRDCANSDGSSPHVGPSTKKLNKMKRSNLLRWSSGYL
ncbi:hypothetical protein Q1695_000308 [Nippostrongylus brasiliensis]|nr:hypothetical protein Q1695_000308 [Nippostrongylus brasiliensis]